MKPLETPMHKLLANILAASVVFFAAHSGACAAQTVNVFMICAPLSQSLSITYISGSANAPLLGQANSSCLDTLSAYQNVGFGVVYESMHPQGNQYYFRLQRSGPNPQQ